MTGPIAGPMTGPASEKADRGIAVGLPCGGVVRRKVYG
ncbi:hypothetical protein ABIA31_005486 [Catenulispora sp. MAP5-51]